MIDYYPHLIEFSIEFKRFSRKYLADLKSKVVSILMLIKFISKMAYSSVFYSC